MRESKQTGSGGSKLTTLDELILDAIGRDSPYMAGIDSEADDPQPSVQSSSTRLSLVTTLESSSRSRGNRIFARSSVPPPVATDDSQTQSEFEFRRPFQDVTGMVTFIYSLNLAKCCNQMFSQAGKPCV